MRAIMCTKYGAPEVLFINDVPKPSPKDNEVLIRIHETIVTPADCASRKGEPFIVRFFAGLFKPKGILGVELGGVVEEAGEKVTRFQKGDHVYGSSSVGFGAHAEYICLPADGTLAPKPSTLGFGEAAAISDGGLTALTFLQDKAQIQEGHKVLINGASGSVGTFAVQIAKYFGAHVTGVCSGKNAKLVRSLGADKVVDYTQEDFTKNHNAYDIIFDTVAKSSFSASKKALKPKGKYLTTVPTFGVMLQVLWTSIFGGKKAMFAAAGLNPEPKKFTFLKELAEEGVITPVIDKRFTLDEIVDAHKYVETGRKKGNIVVSLTS